MPLESPIATIASLNALWPLHNDSAAQGDDHIRNIKDALKKTFPNVSGVVNATHTQLNKLTAALGVADGGTGATTKEAARTNLEVPSTDTATTSDPGLMSASDKIKLNGIADGAQVNSVTSVAGKTGAVTLSAADVGASDSGHTHSNATGSVAGFMSEADKTKLDGIATGAQVNRSIASQAAAEAGTDNSTDMTPLRVAQAIASVLATAIPDAINANVIGIGQRYYDDTATWNGLNTAYQNTYGRPILIHVSGHVTSTGNFIEVSHNGSTWVDLGPSVNNDGDDSDTNISFILPAGHYWRRVRAVSSVTLGVVVLR